jgi:Zn-dependent protease/CBS domain-containing protein
MRSHIALGRIFGIEIDLDYSWFIIAWLLTFSVAQRFRSINKGWSPNLIWSAAILTAVLFFLSLLAHELAHSLVARAHKIPVRQIRLFALGGVSVIEKEATTAKAEFLIAIVGPITSVALGALMLLLAAAAGGNVMSLLAGKPDAQAQTAGVAILFWLGITNLGLGVFNMLPGFPLDGGRILRAVVWWITGNMERATRTAARAGQLMAVVFIGIGIYQFFGGAGVGGLWIAFIGWFLLQAASANFAETELKHALAGLHAGDLMSRDCAAVPGHISVQDFVDEFMLRTGRRCFFVTVQDRIAGMITPHEVRTLDRGLWAMTPLQQVMKRLDQVRSVGPETAAVEALEVMTREDLNQLPVVSTRGVEGMLSRSNILDALRSRRELESRIRHSS